MAKNANFPPKRGPAKVHLYRGSACVRGWSKYEKIAPNWTLCGIYRNLGPKSTHVALCVETNTQVDCPYCICLMKPELGKESFKVEGIGL